MWAMASPKVQKHSLSSPTPGTLGNIQKDERLKTRHTHTRWSTVSSILWMNSGHISGTMALTSVHTWWCHTPIHVHLKLHQSALEYKSEKTCIQHKISKIESVHSDIISNSLMTRSICPYVGKCTCVSINTEWVTLLPLTQPPSKVK